MTAAASAVPCPGTATASGTVAVSMPYWRTPETVRAAVEAVLGQTHTDLRLYVVNDGDLTTPPWPVLEDVTDPRLIRVDMPVNRGRYFCDAAVLAACDTPWFAIHDADDVAAPDWLATLTAACDRHGWVAAFAPQTLTDTVNGPRLEPVADPFRHAPRLRQLAHHAGVYRTDVLRHVGGPHPGYRIGYDTLLVNLVSMAGPIGAVERPLYVRHIRPGSLTTTPATAIGSRARRMVRRELQQLHSRALAHGPGPTIRSHITPELAAAVTAAAAAIRTGTPLPSSPQPEPSMGVLTGPGWGGWALDRHTAEELSAYLYRALPRTVVECGSGMSTLLLAEYASRTGASVTSLEHHETYAAQTRRGLAARNLLDFVDVQVRALTDLETPGGTFNWYGTGLPERIDFALVDGPPGAIGRHAALFALMPRMNPDDGAWEIWLDDAAREGELSCLALWRNHWIIRDEFIPTPKGLARITRADLPPPRPPLDASDVAVTLLTGGRPDLLAATVASVTALAPGLLESAHVAVLHNGADPATATLIQTWDWVDHLTTLEERLPVPQAANTLLGFPAPRPFTLHLEDDWQVATADTGWLDTARNALNTDPRIGQVRLRHRGETVLRTHMVTRRPIYWAPGPDGTQVATAHYTLNPSLMRSADTPQIWPAPDERGAARAFHNLGWLTAQVAPGVFRHIGGGASLRLGERP